MTKSCPDCKGKGTQGSTGVIDCFMCEGKGKIKQGNINTINMSTKDSTFYQVKGYPGLEVMASQIKPLIPKSKIYVDSL